tara:strand:- start:635 stop:1303 length:669 start_codon:yes stop_codon:yes gene_type:complete
MNQVSFDLFWSMRSPYCYLALDRLLEIRERFDVEIKVRVVYPLAIRQPDFFKVRASKHYRSYNLLDTQRWSKYLKVPFRRPVPDPIVQELSTGVVADQQPYIYRLTRVTELATQAGKGMEFLNHVVRLLWDGSTDNWHEGDHLSRAINRTGLDGKTLLERAETDVDLIDTAIATNEAAQEKAGHSGTPLMVFKGEPFFGQDRIKLLIWRLKESGLRERNSSG